MSGPTALHHRLEGPAEAPVLVFSGSLGTSLEMWDGQAAALAGRFRVLRYDQRGHGRSPVPSGPYTVAELGDDLLALLDRLGIERASLCGLSLGGMTGMEVASRAPERVEGLVLCCTSARLGPREDWLERAATVRREGTAAVAEKVLARWFTKPFRAERPEVVERFRAMLSSTPAEGYAACCEAIGELDLCDRLGAIRAPTLVIAGADDPATPPEHGRLIAGSIPGARLLVLERAAHLASVERADAVTSALLDQLGGGEP